MTYYDPPLSAEDYQVLELVALEIVRLNSRHNPTSRLYRRLKKIANSHESGELFVQLITSFFFDADGTTTGTYRDLSDVADPDMFIKVARTYPDVVYEVLLWAVTVVSREKLESQIAATSPDK